MNPFTRLVNPSTKLYARTALDWDLAAGFIVGMVAAALMDDDATRKEGVTLALATGAVGVAIMSVVLAALSVIATFEGPYRRVLDEVGGLREAMAPYLVVAAVAGAAAIVAVLTAIGWAVFSPSEQVVAIGLATFLMGWSVAGTISLVWLTIFHTTQRSRLMGKLEEGTSSAPFEQVDSGRQDEGISVRRG